VTQETQEELVHKELQVPQGRKVILAMLVLTGLTVQQVLKEIPGILDQLVLKEGQGLLEEQELKAQLGVQVLMGVRELKETQGLKEQQDLKVQKVIQEPQVHQEVIALPKRFLQAQKGRLKL
tara:strand:+ start:409 stop:774 length:366 start_codon:yes stop_codon:yes gene_type:complete